MVSFCCCRWLEGSIPGQHERPGVLTQLTGSAFLLKHVSMLVIIAFNEVEPWHSESAAINGFVGVVPVVRIVAPSVPVFSMVWWFVWPSMVILASCGWVGADLACLFCILAGSLCC